SHQRLTPSIWELLGRDESTQQELAESIGMTQSAVSRVMNGYDPATPEFIETVASALGVAPEYFLEYRLFHLEEWLLANRARLQALHDELTTRPVLAEYRAWCQRRLPPPNEVNAQALIRSLLEIVDVEGPVLGARVYKLRLNASGLRETKELRSLLNRASA